MSSVEKVPSNTGKSSPAVVDEKEKTSVDVHDGGSSQGEQAPVLGYSTPGLAPKPRLPYGWQLAVIILTCLCTCAYFPSSLFTEGAGLTVVLAVVGNHWSNVRYLCYGRRSLGLLTRLP